MKSFLLAAICFAPLSANAVITFNFSYADVTNASGFGFADPVEGSTRRATVDAVAAYINTIFDHDASVDITWNASINDSVSNTLGSMGSSYYLHAGIHGGILRDRILSGNNPNADADASGQINFGQTWNSDHTRNVAAGESDLFSVVLHELTHAMGFASLISSNGTPKLDGTYSLYDTFLRNSNNAIVVNAAGEFIGNIADLTSGTMQIETAGGLLQIYSPTTFSNGSSLSHLDSDVDATMNPSITIGTQEREYTTNDLLVLSALGYNVIPEPSSALLGVLGLLLTLQRRR